MQSAYCNIFKSVRLQPPHCNMNDIAVRTHCNIILHHLSPHTATLKNICDLLQSWFSYLNSANFHWLLRGLMTYYNETVSRQKFLSGQHCKVYDVKKGYDVSGPK